ncbi:hypothetical protein [Streptomyces sp. NPDC020298]|uniref:hypothetical protein n=1 Tax=unclassified Streptomyces TaxID=2593676 RepID=UPI0033C3FAAD
MTQETSGPAPGARNIPSLLTSLHEGKRSCTVVLSGAPGGVVHLRDGLVVGMETPGAPGVEVLLLKSGRLTEEEWAAVRTTGADDEHLARELVARGLLGGAELEVFVLGALFDAAFALALTRPESWEVTNPRPVLHTGTGVPPERIVAETSRRLGHLADEPGATARFARDRIQPATAARPPGPTSRLPRRHQNLLAAVDGRRTPRDIAFSLGRGLYAVMVDLRHLLALGLVQHPAPAAGKGRPSTAPRAPLPGPAAPAPAALPRRVPGRSVPETTAAPDSPGARP